MTIDELNEFNKWRETVRMIYDSLHFGNHNVKGGKPAKRIVDFIKDRHPIFFGTSPPPMRRKIDDIQRAR